MPCTGNNYDYRAIAAIKDPLCGLISPCYRYMPACGLITVHTPTSSIHVVYGVGRLASDIV